MAKDLEATHHPTPSILHLEIGPQHFTCWRGGDVENMTWEPRLFPLRPGICDHGSEKALKSNRFSGRAGRKSRRNQSDLGSGDHWRGDRQRSMSMQQFQEMAHGLEWWQGMKWQLRGNGDAWLPIPKAQGRTFLVLAKVNTFSGKRSSKEVIMVDPLEAKRIAAREMEEIRAKEKFERERQAETINGALAMIGLTAGLLIEGHTGNDIVGQLHLQVWFLWIPNTAIAMP
ncbi:hypothetical protein Dimus_016544 [Dionaea muscipula]